MTRQVLLIFVLIIALTFTACQPIEYNDERDRAQIVATVNGVNIYKGDFNDKLDSIKPFFEQTATGETKEEIEQAIVAQKEAMLETLIDEEIRRQKVEDYGLDITESEVAEIEDMYYESIDRMINFLGMQYEASGIEITEEELKEAAEKEFESQGVTKQQYIDNGKVNVLIKKLQSELTKEMEDITDDELEDYYKRLLAYQKDEFVSNPSKFENAIEKGELVIYIPEGYRRVKRLFLRYSDIECSMITELKRYNKPEALEDTIATAYRNISGRIEEMGGLIESGEMTFDELIDKYSDDVQPEGGYYVSSNTKKLDDNMVQTAMELKAPGDISEPVREDLGAGFVMYAGDLGPWGAIALSEVREKLLLGAKEEKSQEFAAQRFEEWKFQSDVVRYPERL